MRSLNRVVMQKESRDWITSLGPEKLDVLELSGKWGQTFPFRSYRALNRWKFDPCKVPMLDEAGKVVRFDLIMANQVWEHLDRPYAATRNIYPKLRSGGSGSGSRSPSSPPSMVPRWIAPAGPRGG
jgi:hypothetical protein